jgi:hypothetical protein
MSRAFWENEKAPWVEEVTDREWLVANTVVREKGRPLVFHFWV